MILHFVTVSRSRVAANEINESRSGYAIIASPSKAVGSLKWAECPQMTQSGREIVDMKRVFVLVFLSVAGPVGAADAYICTADGSTGFVFRNSEWQTVSFEVSQNRYLVRKATENDDHSTSPWLYGEFGQSILGGQCDEPFSTGLMNCRSAGQDFRMNTKTMRYQLYPWIGYVISNESGIHSSDTPYIEIGRCSPL